MVITQSVLTMCQHCLLQRSSEFSYHVISVLRSDLGVTLKLSISSAPLNLI